MAIPGIGQFRSCNADFTSDQLCSLVPIVAAFQAHDDGLTVPFPFCQLHRLPFVRTSNQPVIVIKQRFSRFGVRKHLDPTFDAEQA
jgi:hypothetical protein